MIRTSAVPLLLCVILAPATFAFNHHLSPDQVREAYVLGRDRKNRDALLAQYVHTPQSPDTGPDVASIEFRTPYELVALRARDNQWSNYSPADAEKDYESHAAEVIVRVLIYETPTFDFPASNAQPDTGGFKFRISQDRRTIPYHNVVVDDAAPVGAGSGPGGDGGIDVRLHFDASQFESDNPVTVDVIAPTGQTFSAAFDVAALK